MLTAILTITMMLSHVIIMLVKARILDFSLSKILGHIQAARAFVRVFLLGLSSKAYLKTRAFCNFWACQKLRELKRN